MSRSMVLVLASVLAALMLTGCEQIIGGVIERATGVQVSEDGEAVTIRGKDGEEIRFGGGELAEELRDFPVPSGFTVDQDSSGSISSKEGRLVSGAWTGNQSVDQVTEFYKRELPNQGYTEQFTALSGGNATLQYENQPQNRTLSIVVRADGSTTNITVLMTISSQ